MIIFRLHAIGNNHKFRRDPINKPLRKPVKSLPIATVLALSFGTLVVITVVIVLGISLISGLTNTRDLLIDKASAAMSATQNDFIELLNPAAYEAVYMAELINAGRVDVNNREQLNDFLLGAISGTPQINTLAFVSPDLQVTGVHRQSKEILSFDESKDPVAQMGIADLATRKKGSWGPLVYVPTLRQTVLNFREPAFQDGKFIGALIASITVSTVNTRMNAAPSLKNSKRFILYGKDRVMMEQGVNASHETMGLNITDAVPKLDEIEDPVLRAIWSDKAEKLALLGEQTTFNSHYLEVNGQGYIYVYKEITGYADKPFTIGYWLLNDEVSTELWRLLMAGLAGLGIMLLSTVVAIVIGRKISRPVLALSTASRQISLLDFNTVKALPASRFTEVNEANNAYNSMLRGLAWFETYVPKSLVRKLMESGEARSEERVVTVMFTDIVGFTPQAEDMKTEEVADFLNHHFELVTACIEAEGGTVDKFIGDAVMAFWGAPERQEDHAARACRAAKAIKKAIMSDNEKRHEAGLSEVHMRIGIHTGALIVGNIGAAGRLNYTVVGDTVNIAQRMEQFGKTLSSDRTDEVFTLMTSTTFDASPDTNATKIGDYQLKGRHDPVTIYRLED
ncbi:adenylate/guanylate cyclase domain-containing protein [Sneathiella litorea]|uniref:HAMP domain-containing protein n=1 Tax=Sneathiella litorea TaxID=2606216 RepID=A0A6L8W4I4_9PROT|nr:adenylate/guanylate cyclase domain-containing protein [Sneathiella litorea]MZR30005.1 HAMP domain-containing protein [Sneathiella litorea]